jgi:hypothetical protein
MIPKCIHPILAGGVAAISLWIIPPVFAEEFRDSNSFYRSFQGHWSLNPAGQLQLWFDPLHNGQDELEETYTVVLTDRAPKMCGDPDGTGRHTWFFTDALLIEVMPVRSQATPIYPQTQDRKELP